MLEYKIFVKEVNEAYGLLTSAIEHKKDEKYCIDVFKRIVTICIPSASNLLKEKTWHKLWNKYQKRAEDILMNHATANNCSYFIDYALIFTDNRFSEGDRIHTYKLFSAFNSIIEELNNEIQSNDELINKFQKRLDEKIIEAVTDGPTKADNSNNSAFKNFVNEIAFFYQMAVCQNIELVGIEVPLPNGRTADFQLLCDGEIYLVDTITIHNTIEQDDINRFVEGKVNDKFLHKTENLDGHPVSDLFRVLPIIESNDIRLLDYVPTLPQTRCFPPMMSLLHEIENKNSITLETFPLDEKVRTQLKKENNETD